MRVIAGSAKGRKLKAPPGDKVRPTGDKVKGAVFNILEARLPYDSFLDLFAGSGAMGIEAWSRGAQSVVFIEKDPSTYRLLLENLKIVGLAEASTLCADWRQALAWLTRKNLSFDVIYVDPPFTYAGHAQILSLLKAGDLLRRGGLVCLEHASSIQLPQVEGWRVLAHRRYGKVAISLLTYTQHKEA